MDSDHLPNTHSLSPWSCIVSQKGPLSTLKTLNCSMCLSGDRRSPGRLTRTLSRDVLGDGPEKLHGTGQ